MLINLSLRFFIVTCFLSIVGCAVPTVQPGEQTSGPVAMLNDSYQTLSRSKGNLYYVEKLDGVKIKNALTATAAATSGMGSQLVARGASRPIPARKLTLHLVGRTYHAAPIGQIMGAGSNYLVEGTVEFTPEANQNYLVKGTLGEGYSAVWVENMAGERVSEIVKIGEPRDDTAAEKADAMDGDTKKRANLTREELFLGIASGESVELVVAKIGEPSRTSRYAGNFMIEKLPYTTYEYDGLGSIQFSEERSKPKFVQRVIAVAGNQTDLGTVSSKLANSSGMTLQSLVKDYYSLDIKDIQILDLFAKKLWLERHTADPYTADAIAWLAKTLAKSGNARYRSVLQELVDDPKISSKISKHARSSLKLLPAEEVEQFVP